LIIAFKTTYILHSSIQRLLRYVLTTSMHDIIALAGIKQPHYHLLQQFKVWMTYLNVNS